MESDELVSRDSTDDFGMSEEEFEGDAATAEETIAGENEDDGTTG